VHSIRKRGRDLGAARRMGRGQGATGVQRVGGVLLADRGYRCPRGPETVPPPSPGAGVAAIFASPQKKKSASRAGWEALGDHRQACRGAVDHATGNAPANQGARNRRAPGTGRPGGPGTRTGPAPRPAQQPAGPRRKNRTRGSGKVAVPRSGSRNRTPGGIPAAQGVGQLSFQEIPASAAYEGEMA